MRLRRTEMRRLAAFHFLAGTSTDITPAATSDPATPMSLGVINLPYSELIVAFAILHRFRNPS
jgi:hypothetical protein